MTTKAEAEVAVAAAAAAPRMSFWPSFGDISTKYCSAARLEFHVPGLVVGLGGFAALACARCANL